VRRNQRYRSVAGNPKELQEASYRLPEHWTWARGDRHWHLGVSAFVAKLLGERLSGGEVLDLGCGDGKGTYDVQALLGSSFRLSGVDYSARAIGFARLLAPGIAFHVGDASANGGRDRVYDAVIFREVLEHLDNQEMQRVPGALYRLLRPGGLLVLTTPHRCVPVSPKHFEHFDAEMLTALLRRGGFAGIAFFGFGRVVPRLLVGLWNFLTDCVPVAWRVCRLTDVPTSPYRCRTLVAVARRPSE